VIGKLYVVATPIGNLSDITLRALEVLKRVDLIAAEDTRTTRGLLHHHAIASKLFSLHEHNERASTEKILALLAEGKSVALVSDAGTPTISDPGAFLVAQAHATGYCVVPLPGANAAISALSASGLAGGPFLFYGFLASRSSARRRELEALQGLPFTLVFYEAPHRVIATVEDLCQVLGNDREIVIARELTKMFECIHRCALGDAEAWLSADPNRQKGEFVLLVSATPEQEATLDDQELSRVLSILLRNLSLKEAVKLAAELCRAPRNVVYAAALSLKAALDDAAP
jgi:16S rRNA (cytidine1402-2'-O)-methyltransferase